MYKSANAQHSLIEMPRAFFGFEFRKRLTIIFQCWFHIPRYVVKSTHEQTHDDKIKFPSHNAYGKH